MLKRIQATALVVSLGYALTLGCSEEKLSKAGESCGKTADCEDGLSCSEQVCLRSKVTNDGVGGQAGSTAVQLGAEGESCLTRRDCVDGLLCIRNTCSAGSDAGTPRVGGTLGESCQVSSDCAEAYVCVQSTCVLGDLGVEPTSNECVLVQCEKPVDCCPKPNAQCATWKQQCDIATGAGGAGGGGVVLPSSCTLFNNPSFGCKCDETKFSCNKHVCKDASSACTLDEDCFGLGKCNQGECVACVKNEDCDQFGVPMACSKNQCVAACKNDSGCPAFSTCQNGACVETGCKDDRECIASKKDARSRCQAGKCATPCDKDAECNIGTFSFQGCVKGYCQELGCKTHQECKIRLNRGFNDQQQALCLPKAQ
jgi:hypothetical protein